MSATAFLGERPVGQLAELACAPHSTEWAEVWSMVDGSPMGTLPVGTPDDLAEAVRRVRDAQRAWGAMPAGFRVSAVRRLADLLDAYRDPIAELVAADTGTAPAAVAGLVTRCGPQCRRLARAAVGSLRPVRHRDGLRVTAVEVREPRGVVGIVPDPPAPFDPATATAALMAGNGLVFVPTLRSGFTALLLTRLFSASRLPAGLVQVVPGRPELATAAAAVVDHLVVGESLPRDGIREACAGRGIALASGPRTDPLEFATTTVVRR